MKTRFLRYLPFIVFLVLAVLPTALFTITGPWPGPVTPEFGPLRPFPSGFSSKTFRRIGDWFSDRLGLRWPLLYLGTQVTDRVWQPRVRNSVILGNEPWLFWTDDESHSAARMADARGELQLSDDNVAAIDALVRSAHAAYAACGKKAFAFVAPNKQSIYPEELGLRGAGSRPSRLDGLLARLSPEARALVIDPRPDMRAAKGHVGAPLYYSGDTHWNELGAYYGYRAVVTSLARHNAIDQPELSALDRFEMTIGSTQAGDIRMRMLYRPADEPDQVPQFRALAPPDIPAEIPEANYSRYVNLQGRGRLVVHGDSFAAPLATFLARHFAETFLLPGSDWPRAFDGVVDARWRADVVLVEIVERSLPELTKASLNIDKACTN
jgi:alginate O-acetyltransferase complex protein AlgJ